MLLFQRRLHSGSFKVHEIMCRHGRQVIRYLLFLCLFVSSRHACGLQDLEQSFHNPIAEGADPWVVNNPLASTATEQDPDHFRHAYYWCLSDANRRIAIFTSNQLTGLGRKHVVWQAPESGLYSRQLWAPELHYIEGHWYIYVAASDGDNANHLAYVLKSRTRDVFSEYEVVGPLATGEGPDGKTPNIWAIDMTVFTHQQKRYAIWSGWDAPGTDRQYLYIAAMDSPTHLSSPRVRLCANDDFLWERLEPAEQHRGLNEGPEIFQVAGRTFLFYSCGASWLDTYKLGVLELVGEDPLDPGSWKKSDKPAFESTPQVYGVGHSCFVQSPDGSQWWHVYHAKRDRNPGWRRAIHVQPMSVDKDGLPDLGKPLDPSIPLKVPAGQVQPSGQPLSQLWKPLEQASSFKYFGHHQMISVTDLGTPEGVIRLGQQPKDPVNDYRCGEKLLWDLPLTGDYQIEVAIQFVGDGPSRDAGILFRCQQPAVGYDAQQGYFAGLIPASNLVILGRTDGRTWKELARAPMVETEKDRQILTVVLEGESIQIQQNGQTVIQHRDATYKTGSVGLRVVNSDARFGQVEVRPMEK